MEKVEQLYNKNQFLIRGESGVTFQYLNLEDEFMEYLSYMLSYSKELTLTDINDFIWFEVDDWIEEHKEEITIIGE